MYNDQKTLSKKECAEIKKKLHFLRILGYPCTPLVIEGGVHTLTVYKPYVQAEFIPSGFFYSTSVLDKNPDLATCYFYEDLKERDHQYNLGNEFYKNKGVAFYEKEPESSMEEQCTKLLSKNDLIIMYKEEGILVAERQYGFEAINKLYELKTSRMKKGEAEGMIIQDILF